MPKPEPATILPTAQEDAAIDAAIAADPDSRELDDEWFAQARPAREVMPPEIFAALVAIERPNAPAPKVSAAIELDADLLDAFKATGKG